MAKLTIKRRPTPPNTVGDWPSTTHPVIQRIYASRGLNDAVQAELRLARLLNPSTLGGLEKAVDLLVDAIDNDKRIMVSGDYDCDGATGTAVGVRGLRMLGAKHVSFIVPDRFKHGYGLSPGLVEDMTPTPDVIVTVDSGVSSVEGVRAAKAKGITVIVTDHHLPGEILPDADAMVNPNLKGDDFPSKALAGVGVMFYLLIALRSRLRSMQRWDEKNVPDISQLLDLVALGTVADLVSLDQNNRIIVNAGLRMMRYKTPRPGIQALFEVAGRPIDRASATDIGFSIGPRLNAAGRLENMKLGIETLITDNLEEARAFAKQLDDINRERRAKQDEMIEDAEAMLAKVEGNDLYGIVVYDPSWHSGIVGLVASKIKESFYRPVVAFAPGGDDSEEVRGSARSIPGFHLRDALAAIDVAHPGLILKFGGHAMAAGLSLRTKDIEVFQKAFDDYARRMLTEDLLQAAVISDGPLMPGEITLQMAWNIVLAGPWGQNFPEPIFDNEFDIVEAHPMGATQLHQRFVLRDPRDGSEYRAVYFNSYTGEEPPPTARFAYSLNINVWQEKENLQLLIHQMEV